MRKITFVSTRDDVAKSFDADFTTWGQLKAHINSLGVNTSDLKVMVRETKNNLDNDSAVLPEGEFTVILSPGKMKSGL